MRVGYARVSTTDQSPDLQLEALRRVGCERVFTERASGARDDRPELTRIVDDVLRAGDTLVVWKLDRLARSLKMLITTADDLARRGIGLVSLTESLDTTTPGCTLIFHVFGAIAHFERRLIAERTKDGIAAARAKGKRPGRQPVDADKVQAALRLVESGLSPTKAAVQLGLGRSTVYREVAAAGVSRMTS